jgi:hypothetical protein
VDYATAANTASGSSGAGQDFVPTSGTLTFIPGATTQTFTVTVNATPALSTVATQLIDENSATAA